MFERLRQFPFSALGTVLLIAIGWVTNKITGDSPPPYLYGIGGALVLLVVWIEIVSHRKNQPGRDIADYRKRLQRGLRQPFRDQMPEAALDLSFAASPAAIRPPRVLEQRDAAERDITRRPVSEVFEEMGGRMLVLGEPGAGKTTLLYELALLLIDQPEYAYAPLVFNLSGWAKRPAGQSFREWLAGEMSLNYPIGKDLARDFLDKNQLALLLDGLDEVAPEAQRSCVETINEFLKTTACPLALCCRKTEYEAIGEKLALSGAVRIKSVSEEQVLAWCEHHGFETLKTAWQAHPPLREILNTPLLLRVAQEAFSAENRSETLDLQDAGAARAALWSAYLRQALGRKNETEERKQGRHFAPEKMLAWLQWLARYLEARNLTAYHIERMQPDALEGGMLKWYRVLSWAVIGLAGGPVIGPAYVLAVVPSVGLAYGLAVGLAVGLVAGPVASLAIGFFLKKELEIFPMEQSAWDFSIKSLAAGMAAGLAAGMAVGLVLGLIAASLALGLALGLTFCLTFGIVNMRTQYQLKEQILLEPNEGIRRSVRNAVGSCIPGLVCIVLALSFWDVLEAGFDEKVEPAFLALLCSSVFLVTFPLEFGGVAVLRHYVLRYLLHRSGRLPFLDLIPFLERCRRLGLLRRVGGGYVFFHRELRDFLVREEGFRV